MSVPRTLKQLHDAYGGDSIFSAAPDAEETPRCVWEYDYSTDFSAEKLGRIRSAALLDYSSFGGRHRYTFAFFDTASPDLAGDGTVGLLNFKLDAEGSAIEAVAPMGCR
jgi:hypothetical protein